MTILRIEEKEGNILVVETLGKSYCRWKLCRDVRGVRGVPRLCRGDLVGI